MEQRLHVLESCTALIARWGGTGGSAFGTLCSPFLSLAAVNIWIQIKQP